MLREFSAGGVVIDGDQLAVIRPQGRPDVSGYRRGLMSRATYVAPCGRSSDS
jgi:hypothetical protein